MGLLSAIKDERFFGINDGASETVPLSSWSRSGKVLVARGSGDRGGSGGGSPEPFGLGFKLIEGWRLGRAGGRDA